MRIGTLLFLSLLSLVAFAPPSHAQQLAGTWTLDSLNSAPLPAAVTDDPGTVVEEMTLILRSGGTYTLKAVLFQPEIDEREEHSRSGDYRVADDELILGPDPPEMLEPITFVFRLNGDSLSLRADEGDEFRLTRH